MDGVFSLSIMEIRSYNMANKNLGDVIMKKYYLILVFVCVVLTGFAQEAEKEIKAIAKILSRSRQKKDNYWASFWCLQVLKFIKDFDIKSLSKTERKSLDALHTDVLAYMKKRWGKYPPYTIKSNLKFKILGKTPKEAVFGSCGFTTGADKFIFIPGEHIIQFEPVNINKMNVKEYVAEINRIGVSRLLLPYKISQSVFTILMNGINVEYLTLYCPAIKNISMLKHSTKLKELNLTIFQHMQGFESLHNLKGFEKIIIDSYDFDFKNLSFLGEIPNLKSLYSYSSDLESLKGIENLENLQELYIFNTDKLSSIAPIGKNSNFKKLHLRIGNSEDLKEITPIGKLQDLRELVLDVDDVDISPLGKLSKLKKLELHLSKECDLSSLSKLHNLHSLVPPFWIKNLNFIKNSQKLEKFKATWSQLNDLSGLVNFPKLKKLDLSYCKKINDYSPVGKLSKLQVLYLSAASVKEIDFVKNLKSLKTLHMIHNEMVKDFTPLLLNPAERINYCGL